MFPAKTYSSNIEATYQQKSYVKVNYFLIDEFRRDQILDIWLTESVFSKSSNIEEVFVDCVARPDQT